MSPIKLLNSGFIKLRTWFIKVSPSSFNLTFCSLTCIHYYSFLYLISVFLSRTQWNNSCQQMLLYIYQIQWAQRKDMPNMTILYFFSFFLSWNLSHCSFFNFPCLLIKFLWLPLFCCIFQTSSNSMKLTVHFQSGKPIHTYSLSLAV